ncbi:putative aminopeptidase-2 [Anticarsia gemmatalis]|uniref:putative aminopeptidase-2 n=1 Tax=Anticarsia gemmatalis TaxID=129554 RepID=UPI003F76CF6F
MQFITVTLLALIALGSADFPLDIEDPIVRSDAEDPTTYRLPEDLDPVHYEIEVVPYFIAEGTKEAFTFDGKVTITVTALVNNLNKFVIQENVREIVSVTVLDQNNAPVRLDPLNPFERIRQYHFLQFNLAEGTTLTNGQTYKLIIEYIGNINETPLSRGVFRGSYTGNDGRKRWYAATHLQPTNSRQAFPSFDEPGFKSTFDIIINRPASYGQSFSNMQLLSSTPNGNRVREVFQRTPRMSAYLVTFHISEDFAVIADNNNAQRSYRILARPNAVGQGEYALEVGPPLTDWLGNYFGIDYYSMEPNIKNDQIASPYWASGATENWGLVTYRELRLLYEEGETNALDKMNIGTITAHELAHKWFGNLITCRWWDNVWINEGFASYFEYFAMDGIDKTLELEDQFNIMYVQSALSTDSSASTRALQHTVNSPTEVTGHFSGISYSKGASLLLMLKHLVTENTFKKALNYFLTDKAYEHAFPADLYAAFTKAVSEDGVPSSTFDIAGLMKYWVDEPGYPLLNVQVNMESGEIALSQERFFISATATQTEQVWPLPVTFTTGSNPNWENLQPSLVMTSKTDNTLRKNAGEEWVIFNVKQKGIYRVNYDTRNWQLIANALSTNHNNIHHLNRAQIVDDVFALMRSGKMTYQLGFQVIDFLKKDSSYYVWYPAITGFTWLRNRFLHLPEVLQEFNEIIFEFMDHAIETLKYDVSDTENLTTTLNRFFLLTFACNIGHKGCVENAEAKFTALVNNNTPVNPNLRRHVFCSGLRAGGLAEFRFLRNRRINSNNQGDEVAMLRALGCTAHEEAGKEFLNVILTDEVKAQDRVNALTFYYMGNRDNSKIALEWLKENVDDVRKAVVLPAWFNSVLSNIAGYLDEEGLRNMETWLNENQASIPEYTVGLSAIASARNSMQWGTDNAQIVLSAARGAAAIALPTTMILLVTLLSLFLQYRTIMNRWQTIALIAVTCVTIANAVSDTNYRLNTPIVPSAYSIYVKPYFDTNDTRQFTFDGEVTIIVSTTENTKQIKLHSQDLNFTATDITVTNLNSNAAIALETTNALEFNTTYAFAFINLAVELIPSNSYSVNIKYTGPLREDLNGFYRNYYVENGVKKWLAATQMEPTHARKAFPCFDEPGLKATFTVRIDRPANYQKSLSNTKMETSVDLGDGYVRETFYTSPIMPTYLVAFLVSEYEAAQYSTNGTREFGIYTRPEAKSQAAYAFDFGKKVVEELGNFYGIDYYSTNEHLKLDHVSIPDFRAGAMENWGLVKYREALLLYNESMSGPYFRYRIASILAHETTHMWFGNLVTCHWWSDTWLNEGFANYFQDYISTFVEPELGTANLLVTGSVYTAYDADSSPTSPPISNDEVNSPAEISGHFGSITYQKAGSVIRMMHHLIGDDAFKFGLNSYLTNNSFGSGYPSKLYAGLDRGVVQYNSLSAYPNATITDVMASWITQAGHPVVDVNVNYQTGVVNLTQHRFYSNESHSSDEIYQIPITYTTGTSANFTSTVPAFIMNEKSTSFSIANFDHTWVIFNVQETGFYRVNYDQHGWQMIERALKGEDREKIHHLNRAKIVNDLFALFYADKVEFSTLYEVIGFLTEESDYSVWFAALKGFTKLRSSYMGHSDVLPVINEYVLQFVSKGVEKFGFDVKATDSFEDTRNRQQLLELACILDHPGCVEWAVAAFKAFKENGTPVAPSLRPVVYTTGLRYGNGEDYDFLWNQMLTTNLANEVWIIEYALGHTSDSNKVLSYLTSIDDEDEPIKTQDQSVPLSSVLSNHSNVELVLDSLSIEEFVDSAINPLDSALSMIASVLRTDSEFKKFEDFLQNTTLLRPDMSKSAALTSLEGAKAAKSWADTHKDTILLKLKSQTSASSQTIPSILLTVVTCLIYNIVKY